MSEEAETKKTHHWTEVAPNGEKMFCFKIRSHGKTKIYKYTLEEIADFLNRS